MIVLYGIRFEKVIIDTIMFRHFSKLRRFILYSLQKHFWIFSGIAIKSYVSRNYKIQNFNDLYCLYCFLSSFIIWLFFLFFHRIQSRCQILKSNLINHNALYLFFKRARREIITLALLERIGNLFHWNFYGLYRNFNDSLLVNFSRTKESSLENVLPKS